MHDTYGLVSDALLFLATHYYIPITVFLILSDFDSFPAHENNVTNFVLNAPSYSNNIIIVAVYCKRDTDALKKIN